MNWRLQRPKPSPSGEGGTKSGSSEPIFVTDEGWKRKNTLLWEWYMHLFPHPPQSADWASPYTGASRVPPPAKEPHALS